MDAASAMREIKKLSKHFRRLHFRILTPHLVIELRLKTKQREESYVELPTMFAILFEEPQKGRLSSSISIFTFAFFSVDVAMALIDDSDHLADYCTPSFLLRNRMKITSTFTRPKNLTRSAFSKSIQYVDEYQKMDLFRV
jgi:hypothetical protein